MDDPRLKCIAEGEEGDAIGWRDREIDRLKAKLETLKTTESCALASAWRRAEKAEAERDALKALLLGMRYFLPPMWKRKIDAALDAAREKP